MLRRNAFCWERWAIEARPSIAPSMKSTSSTLLRLFARTGTNKKSMGHYSLGLITTLSRDRLQRALESGIRGAWAPS